MKRSLALSLLLYSFALVAGAQEMQPGMYASTTVLELADGQTKTKQVQDCITPKDIADGLISIGFASDPACKVQNYKKADGKISYRLSCKDGKKKLDSDVVGSYTADSYNFTIKPAIGSTAYTSINAKGWRSGVCTPAK